MKIEIKSWLSGGVLFAAETDTLKACVILAVKSGANLTRANLDGANLTRANLDGANLYGANLTRANLDVTKADPAMLARLRITPDDGAFSGWKKLRGDVIAQLVIPHDAQRLNAIGSRKCRASAVTVWNMWTKDGVEVAADFVAHDKHTGKTAYQVGKTVTPDKFDASVLVECSHGIHFFITKAEAEAY